MDNLERMMKKDDDPDKLTLDDLKEKLSDRYAHIIDKEEHKSEKDKELNGNSQQQFNGLCRYCGKYGHRAVVCKSGLQDEANGSMRGQRYQNWSNEKHLIEEKTIDLWDYVLTVGRLDIISGSVKMGQLRSHKREKTNMITKIFA